jgi:hypothetical protein
VRWALVSGATLAAMAAGGGAGADVRTINLDGCAASCTPPAIDEPAAAENSGAGAVTLSRSGGRTDEAKDLSPALIFERRAMPTVLVSGLPSPLASTGASPRGASPYDFFEDVIDVPLPVEARAEFAAASLFLFAPSLIGQLTLTDILSAGNAFFGKNGPPPRPAM